MLANCAPPPPPDYIHVDHVLVPTDWGLLSRDNRSPRPWADCHLSLINARLEGRNRWGMTDGLAWSAGDDEPERAEEIRSLFHVGIVIVDLSPFEYIK